MVIHKAAILENQLSKNFSTIHISSKSSKDHTLILFSTIRRRNRSETCYFKKIGQIKIAFFWEKWWKIDIRNYFSMILTTDSERADPYVNEKTLCYLTDTYFSLIFFLQHFHRKFLSRNQRKILVTSGINGLNDMETVRYKSKKMNGKFSEVLKDRIVYLRSIIKALVKRIKDTPMMCLFTMDYLRRRNDELASQLRGIT